MHVLSWSSRFISDNNSVITVMTKSLPEITTSVLFIADCSDCIHVDNLSDSNAIRFLSLLDHANLTQHYQLICMSRATTSSKIGVQAMQNKLQNYLSPFKSAKLEKRRREISDKSWQTLKNERILRLSYTRLNLVVGLPYLTRIEDVSAKTTQLVHLYTSYVFLGRWVRVRVWVIGLGSRLKYSSADVFVALRVSLTIVGWTKQTEWIGSSTLILSCTVWFLTVVFILSSCSCTYIQWFVVS